MLRRQVAELQAELIRLRAVMSGQVKMLPAPASTPMPNRRWENSPAEKGKAKHVKRAMMVAQKTPQPPLRRLPPSRRLRPSALKRGPRSRDSPRTSRSNFSTCGRAEISRGGRSCR